MNSTPLVSVIIVCYNHHKFIKECLESVFNQSYSNIELLVIDNSDNDYSKLIIESLLPENKFFFAKQDNIGLTRTLNHYIPLTRGKYLIMMSADDVMLRDRVEKQVIYMESHPEYAMGFGNTICIDENSNQTGFVTDKNYRSGYIFNDLVRFKFHPPAPSYIFKRTIFDEVGLYDENIKLIEDRYMNFKIAEKHQVGFLDDFLSYHRQHSNNLTKTASLELQIKDVYYILKRYESLPDYRSIMNDVHLSLYSRFSGLDTKYALRFMLLSLPRITKTAFWKSTYRMIKKIFI